MEIAYAIGFVIGYLVGIAFIALCIGVFIKIIIWVIKKQYENVNDMQIEKFIEKAIEGGGLDIKNTEFEKHLKQGTVDMRTFALILLDPLAWKAVGKVEGWSEEKFYPFDPVHATGETISEAQWHFRCMGNALWEGKTIEEYIKTL